MTAIQITTADELVSFLTTQHQEIKSLLQSVIASTGEERERAFVELRRFLAVHETAEEEIVHPRARSEIRDGHYVVFSRLQEENRANQALAELEKMDLGSHEFDVAFERFRAYVIAHAEAEERDEFQQLHAELDAPQLERMRIAVKLAESMSRAYAGVDSPSVNMVAGSYAAMMIEARDLIRGKPDLR